MLSKKSMMFALMLVAASLGLIGWAGAGVARAEAAPQLEASFDLPREEGVARAEAAPQLEASFDLPREEGVARDAFAIQLERDRETATASDAIDLPETSGPGHD